jgi:CBS domain-containing protein
MSRDPISISPEASVQEAIELMKTHSIRHLPVLDGQERLVGWVSDTELRGVFIASMIEELTVGDVMIADPITVFSLANTKLAACRSSRMANWWASSQSWTFWRLS